MWDQASYLKILVSGPYASGKTTFVKTVSDVVLTTEVQVTTPGEQRVKEYTTVAFDYGKVVLDGIPIYIFGTPGQTRLQFMWRVLSYGMHGYIFLVDGSSLLEVYRARPIYLYMRSIGDHPHIIAVNKQDVEGAVPPAQVAQLLNVNPKLVCPLIAKDKANALSVLKRLVNLITSTAR
ncbi:MAG: ATP/GTP-binding protein [Thermofilum sp.]|jgi:small GTP-binding protein|nr:ATP/GTP-binding protein [Thermofilum sp.]